MAAVTIDTVTVGHDGETVTVAGHVNGVALTAFGWVSATVGMTGPQKVNYVATLLRDAWRVTNPQPQTLPLTGAVTLPD